MRGISQEALDYLESVLDTKIAKATNSEQNTFRARVMSTDDHDITWIQVPGIETTVPVDVRLIEANDGDIVSATFQDGMVILDGNQSFPAPSSGTIGRIAEDSVAWSITNGSLHDIFGEYVDSLIVGSFTANFAQIAHAVIDSAEIKSLFAEKADIDFANIDVASIEKATIDSLVGGSAIFDEMRAQDGTIDNFSSHFAQIDFANVLQLDTQGARIHQASIDQLVSASGVFEGLHATEGVIDNLRSQLATIDFANVTNLVSEGIYTEVIEAIRENVSTLMAESVYITGDVTATEGTFTKYLTGVNINGDLIKANTIVADRIIYPGEFGMYYMLNYHGGYTPVVNTPDMDPSTAGPDGSPLYEQQVTVGSDGKEHLVYVETEDGNSAMTVYNEAIPASGSNPSEGGYYEYNSATQTYVPTQDTSVMEFVPIENPPEGVNPAAIGYYERSGEEGSYVYTLTEDTYLVIGKTYYAQQRKGKKYYLPGLSTKKYFVHSDEDLPLTSAQYQSALDGSRIVASSITANELNVENITATGNAFMNHLQANLLEADQVRVGANGTMHILLSRDPQTMNAELGFYNGDDELYVLVKPNSGDSVVGYYVKQMEGGRETYVKVESGTAEYGYVEVLDMIPESDPSVLGYYEYDSQNEQYVLTSDTSPVDGKNYYDHRPVPDYYELRRNYDARVAYIDGYRLMIPYSVVLNQMILGEWAWTYRKNGNMDLVYIGTEE